MCNAEHNLLKMPPPEEISFPVYRMYKNGLTWVRIDSPVRFTEIRKFGTKYECFEYEAKILPDRNHIHDLIHSYSEFAEDITEDVFRKVAQIACK